MAKKERDELQVEDPELLPGREAMSVVTPLSEGLHDLEITSEPPASEPSVEDDRYEQ
jgi:hypothetical protein